MKSKNTIQMDFTKAYHDAERIDDIARKLKQLSNANLEQSMQNLAASWKGQNATAFIRKEQQLQQDMKITANTLNGIADDVRRVAKRVYDAEMTAYKIAMTRTASGSGGGDTW